MERTVTLRQQVAAGIVAGVVGGVLFDIFLFGEQISLGKPAGEVVAGTWAWVAATLLGPAAFSNPAAPAIGAAVHLAVAIFWALGYVYLVRTQPQLLTRPWVSGAGFGLVVYIFMQIVLITAGQYHRPSPVMLLSGLVAHIVFYGIPVALIVSRSLSSTHARA